MRGFVYTKLLKQDLRELSKYNRIDFNSTFADGLRLNVASTKALREYHEQMLLSIPSPRALRRHAADILTLDIKGDVSICRHLLLESWLKPHKNVRKYLEEELRNTWVHWRLYSGNIVYPVPAPHNSLLTAGEYFHKAYLNGELWTGTYGVLRKSLLGFIIKEWL